jgi:serine/threonine-protein kinase
VCASCWSTRAASWTRGRIDPAVRQPVQRMLATLYGMRGDLGKALELYEAGPGWRGAAQSRRGTGAGRRPGQLRNDPRALERGKESLAAYQRAARLRRTHAPGDRAAELSSLHGLGFGHYRMGDHKAAEAESGRKASRWPNPCRMRLSTPRFQLYEYLGTMLAYDGDAARGVDYAKRALAFAEKRRTCRGFADPGRPVACVCPTPQGIAGNLKEAEANVREAIRIESNINGADSPNLGKLYNSLGLVRGRSGRYREAIEAAERAEALQAAPWRCRWKPRSAPTTWQVALRECRRLRARGRPVCRCDARHRTCRRRRCSDGQGKVRVRQARAIGLAGDPARAVALLLSARQDIAAHEGPASMEYAFATLQTGVDGAPCSRIPRMARLGWPKHDRYGRSWSATTICSSCSWRARLPRSRACAATWRPAKARCSMPRNAFRVGATR